MCKNCENKKFSKEQMEEMRLADSCGMAFSGTNCDGEIEFIGTSKQWKELEKLKDEVIHS